MEHSYKEEITIACSSLPSDAVLCDLADLYKLFSDSTRLKILFALLNTELCVCAICELLNMEQSAISHQLKKLRNANLVKCCREGKLVHYSLADEHVGQLLRICLAHFMEV